MNFHEQLILTFVDKAAIGALLLLGSLWANHFAERLRANSARENEKERLRAQKHLDYLERQLSEFYYPIYIRLLVDGATWERVFDRDKGNDEVRRRVGNQIERDVLLPNHEAVVAIIQTKIHLAESDHEAFDAILKYVRHVSVYRAMRAAGCYDRDPAALNEPWPSEFLPIIERTTRMLQRTYDALLKPSTLIP